MLVLLEFPVGTNVLPDALSLQIISSGVVMSPLSVLISGAGVTGLAAARVLTQAGHQVKIVERMAEWHRNGAGIGLPGNASVQLDRMGLLEDVKVKSQQGRAITYFQDDGRLICQARFDDIHPENPPFLALPHYELHKILRRSIAEVPVYMGQTVRKYQQSEQGVDVELENGQTLSGNLLLVCDGIHSPIRGSIYPDHQLTDLGLFCWRFITQKPDAVGTDPELFFGRNNAFLIYPLLNNQAYCYGHRVDQNTESLTEDKAHEQLWGQFKDYCDKVVSVLPEQPTDVRLVCGRMKVMPEPLWGRGRVLILGDAAHGCGPILQQGIAQGLEDASVLGDELSRSGCLSESINNFVSRRHQRVSWVGQYSNSQLEDISRTAEKQRNELLKRNGPIHTSGWRQLFRMPL